MNNSRFWKLFFVFLAFGLIAVMFLWPSANDERVELSSPTVEKQLENTGLTDVGTTTMKSPRFTGEDKENRRWEIKAKEARQSGALNPDHVWLDEISATATLDENGEVTFEAGEGAYVKEGSKLELKEGVVVKGYGFTLETESLESDLENRSIQGASTVTITNEQGKLEAGEFELQDNGDVIHLKGGVKGRFYPKNNENEEQE